MKEMSVFVFFNTRTGGHTCPGRYQNTAIAAEALNSMSYLAVID